MEIIIIILYAAIHAFTPLLLAGIGELICEKSGVLNLGIEGMMLVGCVSGFITTVHTDSLLIGFIVGAAAGAIMSSIFAFLAVSLRVNQVAAGLALTIFGVGLSGFMGLEYVGEPIQGLANIHIPLLAEIPVIGKLLFQHDLIIYLAFIMIFITHYFLYHTNSGLILRAVGENHNAAHSMGYKISKIRFLAVLFGGAMAGLAGAYLSLAYTPLWSEGMTAGRGWIVLALVVFATWKPSRLFIGALLFGFISIMQLFLQGNDGILSAIPTEFFTMLPYVTTIVVLVFISSAKKNKSSNAPLELGIPFEPR